MKYNVDATNRSLGRIATEVADLLRGKNLASYAPSKLPDSEVVVNNLKKAKFTGNKFSQKKYWHFGYHALSAFA